MHSTIHIPRTDHRTPAIFLDRDGTINVEKEYLYRVDDWEWIPGAIEAIGMFKHAGYRVVVVSNQAGIARGKYGVDEVDSLHDFVQKDLAVSGIAIDAFYYCPHHPDFSSQCVCRKPAPGMLLQASLDLNLDLTRSWMIGDKLIDVKTGDKLGLRSLMVRTGYGSIQQKSINAGQLFDTVLDVAEFIIGCESSYLEAALT